MFKSVLFSTLVLAFAATTAARAADVRPRIEDAFNDFKRRGESVQFAESCAKKAADAVLQADDVQQKFDALVLQARCTYFVGYRAKGDDEKKRIFSEAMNAAAQAKGIMPDRAEGYFFYGISLGRWAEANGIRQSLKKAAELRKTMETVLVKSATTDDGKTIPGKEYDGWGANRTLGRMYYKLPGWPWDGDNQKAEQYLAEAYQKMPQDRPNSLNIVYYADVLVTNGKKDLAKKVLDELIAYDGKPEAYNPDRVPETAEDIESAKAIRRGLK